LTESVKVLYYTDPAAFQLFGGAEIQMLKTKEYLMEMNDNVLVKLFDVFSDKLDEYDILHVFNMRVDCLPIFKLAKTKKLKVVLSPIYWSELGSARARVLGTRKSIIETISEARIFFSNLLTYNYPTVKTLYPFKDFLEVADIILPNSHIEASVLSSEFKIAANKFLVVPNAVEKEVPSAKPDVFMDKYGLRDFILFVGRIEPRKNVLRLLEACKDMGAPLVIIGQSNPWEHEYYAKCKEVAKHNRNVHFLGFMPPHSKELFSAYAAAKVFVLPSLFETPGLVALEAGIMGCNLVVTEGGSTTEYFKNHALYVNPLSTEDIKEKILEAYYKPKNNKLKEHILENYTWDKAAEKTLQAYNLVLNRE
jgi:glycosyltransferase involved in cell wall biosynthesis